MCDQVILTVLHEQERRLSECEYYDCFLFLVSPDPTVRRLRCRVLQLRLKRLPEQITVPQLELSMGLSMGFTVVLQKVASEGS